MKRFQHSYIAIFMTLFSFFSCDSNSNLKKPRINKDFKELLTIAYDYLNYQQDICKKKYNLGSYERWYYDQEKETLEFSDSGIVKIRIIYEEVGSISLISNTWLWSWNNENILPKVKSEISKVREFGKEKNLRRLIKAKWLGDEVDGWEMTAIAAYILKSKGAYCAPTDSLYSYMIFKEIQDLR